MSKCNFESECPGAGRCCLECDIRNVCESICGMLDIDKPRLELEKTMKNCDWYEEDQQENKVNDTWLMNKINKSYVDIVLSLVISDQ